MKKLIMNQKCFVWTLLTTLVIFSVMNIAWALPVNERTQQVQDAIVTAVSGIDSADDVTDEHLAAITSLDLRAEGITALKAGDFEGLSALTNLNLYGNQLSSLPDGIFEGLTALTTLRLGGNTVNPMLITVSLKKVDNGQFKAVARTGAPFAIVLPISAVNGSISENATTVTIARGSVESEALTITRTEGTTAAVTVDIGTLPGLPSNHYGYTFSKSDIEALEVIGGVVSDDPEPEPDPEPNPEPDPEPEPPANSVPAFSDGATTIRTIAENTDAGVNIGTAVAATDTNSGDTLTYTLSGTDAASFDINTTTGQLKTKTALDYETKRIYVVSITVSDGSLTDTITVLINIIDIDDTVLVSTLVAVSDRTPEVRDAIVAAISDVSDAADVTATHLATITALNLRAAGISSLESGDFSGLSALTNLNLYGNQLSSLPDGIFEGLTALTTLRLGGNLVDPMPLIVSLQQVDANQYQAIILAGAPFDVVVSIDATTVTIPQGSVKSDTFTVIDIPEIGVLPTLPANHFGYTFSKSTACNRTSQVAAAIAVAVPGVTDCQNVTEIDLAGITELDLSNKSITSLKEGDFSGMLSLTMLDLSNNQLSSLSPSIFEDMLSLKTLNLSGNTVAPLPLTISLLKVGENQFKAVQPTGAPFAINLSVNVMTGNVVSGAITVTISQGSMESQPQTVTRTAGTTAAVTVDIGTMPSLPAMHSGYTLAKSDNLPLEILESINVAPVFTDGSTTTRSIAENTDAGVNIGSAVAATDANNNTLTYTLSGDDASAFDIVSTSGQLQTKVALDFETKTSYSVTVTVSDSTFTDTITVTINVTNKPEIPPTDDAEPVTETNNAPMFADGDSAIRSVAENTGSGVDIGSSISATDADDDTLEYSLGGINAGSFTIDTTTGQLRTNAALDFETKSSYTVEVTVSDSTDTVTITVAINVTDIDEAVVNIPPVFTEGSSATRSVAENTGAGVDIGTAVSATDANNDTLRYALSGTDAAVFSIDSTTGQLRTSAVLDYETEDTYSVTITVSDGNGGSATITVTINITNVDERPDNSAPVFTEGSSATRSIAENTGSGVDIGTTVSATDADDDTLAYSLSGTDASVFSIDSSSGQLRTSAPLDHETKDTYSVTITVSDGNGGTATITVTISVTDVDEISTNTAPVFAEGSSATRSVDENTASDENIGGAVSATDTDDDTLTYTISGTDATAFSIGSTTGQLSTSATLDYETKSSYSVTITVSDENGGTATINVTIDVTNVNEAPVFADGTSTTRTIAENAGANINIGNTVAATDVDGDTLTYTLGGNPDAASFDIESTTGQLKTKATLDFETKSSYTVAVSVSDSKGGTDSITVTITVRDLDETPSNIPPMFTEGDDPVTRSVAENTASGTNIGAAVSATDADSNTLAYLLSGDDASSFSIDADTGQLKTGVALNYETKASYTVTITVSDGSLTDTINVTISVTNANDPPVFNKGLSTTLSIAENTDATNIGDAFTATDEDGNTLTYSLHTLNDVTPFRIDTSNGQLRTLRPLDYEETPSYTVTIAVDDGKGGFDEIEVTINVTDVVENVAPVFTEGDNAAREVAENTGSGVNIGTPVAATDVDDGDTLTYSLGGDDAESFSINTSNGQLRTLAALDYETKDTYSVSITVDDNNGGSAEIAVTINVTDVDENRAPVFTDGDSTTREVAENTASGVNIGTAVGATDADDDTLTYSLGGDDAESFSINTSNGQLRTHAALDYETKDTYSVTITVDDNNGGSAEIAVTISVTDVNENRAPVFSDGVSTTREVAENTAAGENIGTAVSATDVDNNTLTWTLSGTDASSFSIDSGTGQLQTSAALDFETKSSYSVTITVDDGNGGSDEINVTISITDVDENVAPEFTDGASTTRSVAENTAAGENIGTAVSATDVDNDNLTYILGGDDASSFSIVSATGQLQTSAALDFETKSSYSVTVTVSDGSLTDSISVTINVTDVDENRAPVFSQNSLTRSILIDNDTAVGDNIGAPVTATDPDNDTLTYSLGGDDTSFFSIVSSTGQLQTTAAFLSDTKVSYSIIVIADDRNGGTDSIAVTVTAAGRTSQQVVNSAPEFADGDRTTRSVAENTGSGVNIGAPVSATDVDNDMLTYTLGGTDAAAFSIDSMTGQLQTSAALDYETKDTYSVTITVDDDNDGEDSISVTITVTDVGENRAPIFRDENTPEGFHIIGRFISIAENTAAGQNIGNAISATDADGDTLTYSLGGTLTAPGSDTIAHSFGDDYQAFDIDSATGQLKTKAALDYETKSSYSVVVSASDGKGGSASVPVQISIEDVNEAPEFTDGASTTRSVAENTAADTNIGSAVAATDADGNTLTYTLGGDDTAAFDIDSATGQLKTKAALDYDTKDTYSVTVSVSDGNGGSDSITVTINITDKHPEAQLPVSQVFSVFIDEDPEAQLQIGQVAPVFTDGDSTTRSIDENMAAGENIGTPVAAIDANTSDTLTYTLSGTDAASFSIVSTSGQLQTSAALDYENKPSYEVTVKVTDDSGASNNSATITVTINVSDVNEAPTFLDGESVALSVNKGERLSTSIRVTDDDDDTLEYSLGGTDEALFSISNKDTEYYVPSTNKKYTEFNVQSNAALDYDGKTSYSVTITVSDGNGESDIITVTITDPVPEVEINTMIAVTEPDWVLKLDTETGVVSAELCDTCSYLSLLNDTSSVSFTRPPGVKFDNYFRVVIDLSEEVSGFEQADLTLTNNTAGATISHWAGPEKLKGWTVYAEVNVTMSGSVTLEVAAGAATDGYGNSNAAAESKTVTVTITLTDYPPWDVNEDGSVDATDTALVTAALGQTGDDIVNTRTDVNWDGTVDADDVTLVTHHISGGAPSITGMFSLLDKKTLEKLNPGTLQSYLDILRTESDGSPRYLRAIAIVESILANIHPNKTQLLANYPNPFNPETWIPYHLANPSNVRITIYDMRGIIIRDLDIGHQQAGYYTSRNRAAHWEGTNEIGERVSSGVYFYQLQAGNRSYLRKMLILK